MNCPTCIHSALMVAERAGVKIDYCPTCRGVWLDRGELDRIIEREARHLGSDPIRPPAPGPGPARSFGYDHDDDDHDDDDHRHRRKGRRKSLLGDLFDF